MIQALISFIQFPRDSIHSLAVRIFSGHPYCDSFSLFLVSFLPSFLKDFPLTHCHSFVERSLTTTNVDLHLFSGTIH